MIAEIKDKMTYQRNNYIAEELLNNFLDVEFQAMIRPLNIMHAVFLCPKYCIRDNIVTPNRVFNNTVSFIGFVFYSTVYILRNFVSDRPFLQRIILLLDMFHNITGFAINLLCVILHTENNVSLLLKLHSVYKDQVQNINLNYFKRNNWRFTTVVFLMHFSIFLNVMYYYGVKMIVYPLSILIVFCIDMNLIYAMQIIKVLRAELDVWIREMKSNESRISSVEEKSDDYWKKMFDTYVDILDAFNLYKKVFEVQLLFQFIDSFIHSLFCMYTLIEAYITLFKMNNYLRAMIYSVGIGFWISKNIVLQCILSNECENIYINVNNAQIICESLMAQDECADESIERPATKRRTLKNICRLSRSTFSKFKTCGFFVVGAEFPLGIVSLLITYTIVLFQFKFID